MMKARITRSRTLLRPFLRNIVIAEGVPEDSPIPVFPSVTVTANSQAIVARPRPREARPQYSVFVKAIGIRQFAVRKVLKAGY